MVIAVPEKNYYKALQVDPEAEPEVIQSAYRRLAQLYHPDKNKSPEAAQRMRELNEAWEVLRDPAARRRYDAYLASQRASPSAGAGGHQDASGYESPHEDPRSAPRHSSGESARTGPDSTSHHSSDDTGEAFPSSCQRCHKSDSTLRVASFPWVVSIVVLTFRRAWGGVYCEHCRRVMMTRAKLLTLLFGWWGIPFGPIFSLGVLFRPSQGVVPAEINGPYLAALGAHFIQWMNLSEAARAWELSLAYTEDSAVAGVFEEVFSRPPARISRPSSGALGGAMVGLASLALVIWLFLEGAASYQPRTYARSISTPAPRSSWSTPMVRPTANPTPSATSRLTVNTDRASNTETRRIYYSRGGFSIEVPAGYEVEEYTDPEDPLLFGITVSDDGRVGPSDAVINILAAPLPGYVAAMGLGELRSEAILAVTDVNDDDSTWHQLSEPTARYVPGGAMAETSARWDDALLSGDAAYVRYAAILTDDWAHLVFVTGSDDFHTPVNEYFVLVTKSFQVTP